MMRIAFSVLLIAASIPVGLVSAAAQGNPRLKAEVTVAGDVVRIGDLVENAGVLANTPVFRAPDLGQTGAVPVRAVIDAVRRHGLIAVDARGLSEISVTHASNTIAADDIEQRIAGALTARYKLGTPDGIKIMFDREVRPILRPLTASAELAIARISYDAGSRRFDVSFEISGAERQTWRYTGSAIETIEVAVPTRAFNRGDVVKASDFSIERRAKAEFSNEPPALPSDVAGLAARRPVKLGQPLRGADLMKPELVKKNEMVMLHYEVPGVVLTMRGQALESGSEGDVISVLNVNSKRTIQGVVTGQGRVTILAPTTARLAAAPATE
jgi:flagella basal body P-ring formation protein FlgA